MNKNIFINPLASPSVGAPTLKYGYANTVTTSPGEVKGLITINYIYNNINNFNLNKYYILISKSE